MPLLDSGVTKFNKRCVSLGCTSTGRQVIHFSDHTNYEADLVIGADGIKSVVRSAVVSDGHLVFSNTYAYRGLIPMDTLTSAGLKTEVQCRPHNWVGLGGVCTSLLVILNRSLYSIQKKAQNNIYSQKRYRCMFNLNMLYEMNLLTIPKVECSRFCQSQRTRKFYNVT